MQTQLKTIFRTKKSTDLITIFGYTSKSIPGLEITGLGKYGKTLKEKIIFITRARGLRVRLNRYSICFEYDLESDVNTLKWLDLPVLLTYWFLSGHLSINRLDNCLAIGNITPSGVIIQPIFAEIFEICKKEKLLLICSEDHQNILSSIPLEKLLQPNGEFSFQSFR